MLYDTMKLCILLCFCSVALAHPHYGKAIPDSASYGPNKVEAAAGAKADDAGAAAVAARLRVIDHDALEHYAYEIGRPVLTRYYGALTELISALQPARSHLSQVAPAFVRDSYGKVQFVPGSSLGVIAI